MENLKFGHRVLARDEETDKWEKGRFVSKDNWIAYPYEVLVDGGKRAEPFRQCRLDPDATEFVIGDEVEVRDCDNQKRQKAVYAGYAEAQEFPYLARIITTGAVSCFVECRYPQPAEQPQPAQTIELGGKRYEIRGVTE